MYSIHREYKGIRLRGQPSTLWCYSCFFFVIPDLVRNLFFLFIFKRPRHAWMAVTFLLGKVTKAARQSSGLFIG